MKKNYNYLKTGIITFFILLAQQIHAQTVTVNSLEDLLPYLKQNDVDVKLAPGTYTVNASDITNGTFSNPLFVFEGSNNTYDFTDVKIEINTAILTSFGNVDVNEFQILGNNNVLTNLTIEDIGTTAPRKRAQSIVMDGKDNRIEGFNLTIRGSYPYGYGDSFGKGGGSVIKHRKHSGILIRGLRNHLKGCNIISRSYGHIVFMQAASYPTVEDCYIEGEVRTTDDMLTETSGPAFDVDFMTVWGYTLPAGYMMSLQEGGIRAYNAGETFIDGEEISRGTDNPTVLNCTIKNARTGVVLTHATGTKYIEGCRVYGCEKGYSLGSGTVINCGADAIYGPVLKNDYSSDNGDNSDIRILAPSDEYYNGHKAIAYIGGKNHNITLRSDIEEYPSDLKIMVSGEIQGIRLINGSNPSQNNLTSDDIILKNLTSFPVILHSDSDNISVSSCNTDDVTDDGSNNTILSAHCDSENLALTGTASQSSTAYEGEANRAIDGNANGEYGGDSVTHTDPSDTNGWWQVDLVEESVIDEIVIYNRTGKQSYIDRLSNFAVYVYDNSGEETFSKIFTDDAPDTFASIDAGGILGKSIKVVQMSDNIALSLAEIEVYGNTSSSLSIEPNEFDNSVSLYPSPVVDELNISLSDSNLEISTTKILMYNIKGQKILEQSVANNGKAQLNLSHLPKGIYIVKMSDEHKNITQKVVKQ